MAGHGQRLVPRPSGQNCTTVRENMKSDAQRRAENAYRKKSVRQLVLRFYPNAEDEAMYEWLKAQENVTEYIKALVADDMKKAR